MILFAAMAFLASLALGCLVFMRDKKGALRPDGLIFFIFFTSGTVLCLYLIIFGA